MTAIGDLAKMVERLDKLTKDEYGGIVLARAIEADHVRGAKSVKIEPASYYNEQQVADKEACAAFHAQFVAQYQAEGRRKATDALEAVRAEIHQIRLNMPCAVAAAYAEAYHIANGLEREIAERRTE